MTQSVSMKFSSLTCYINEEVYATYCEADLAYDGYLAYRDEDIAFQIERKLEERIQDVLSSTRRSLCSRTGMISFSISADMYVQYGFELNISFNNELSESDCELFIKHFKMNLKHSLFQATFVEDNGDVFCLQFRIE